MTREEMFDILRPIIMSVTGVPECILADDNEQAPDSEYASVEPFSNITERGQAIVRRSAEGIFGNTSTVVEAQLITECSINFYRGEARIRASRLKQANKIPSVSAALRAGELGWRYTGSVNNLTALQSRKREQRAQISIYLAFIERTEADITNSIESVGLVVQDPAGEVIQADELIVPIPEPLLFGGDALTFETSSLLF